MAEKKKTKNWWWPSITDQASAIEASKNGFWAAVICASITTIFATVSLAMHKDIASINTGAYLDALLFFVIAWRIKNYSKFFAIAAVLMFILEKVILAQTQGAKGWPLAVVILLMFITGARGVFAYHRYSENEPHAKSI